MRLIIIIQYFVRSYPTYEEWKLSHHISVCQVLRGSYPTYEEWKLQPTIMILIHFIHRSYPTYEEWKPIFLHLVFK